MACCSSGGGTLQLVKAARSRMPQVMLLDLVPGETLEFPKNPSQSPTFTRLRLLNVSSALVAYKARGMAVWHALSNINIFPCSHSESPLYCTSHWRLLPLFLRSFQVKSTAPRSYMIKPSAGAIRKGEAAEVRIFRRLPEDGEPDEVSEKGRRDRFLVQAAPADTED